MRSQGIFYTILLLLSFLLPLAPLSPPGEVVSSQRVIVQGSSVESAQRAVLEVGGHVLAPLDIIQGVSARLPTHAIPALERAGLRVTPDHPIRAATCDDGSPECEKDEPELYPSRSVGSHTLWEHGVDGRGITVAFVDSGFPALASADQWDRQVDSRTLYAENDGRFMLYRDLLYSGAQLANSSDPYGHGTHVAMTVADAREIFEVGEAEERFAVGIAPKANIVMVRALDAQGQGNYSTVIQAIDWIVANRERYNIRVLNLSLEGPVVAPYWYDPLGQAVMRAWAEGLVVVTAAGNRGPAPMTIGVPGNVPYAITVGAIKSGRFTLSGEDELATYSSTGPTESKFIKPDVLVPGSRTIAILPRASTLAASGAAGLVFESAAPILLGSALKTEEFAYYKVSGTSMAAAEVSGIVALILQYQPTLDNNQVKYRLTSTALAAGSAEGALYSVWQQGAGRADPVAATKGMTQGSANAGMDIERDLLGEDPNAIHYMGATAYDPTRHSFYLPGMNSGGDDYQSWAGDYQSWAGDYQSWAGDYQSWAGDYQSWAGDYQSWAGDYQSWAGDYSSWAGDYLSWAGREQIGAIPVFQEPEKPIVLFLPMTR